MWKSIWFNKMLNQLESVIVIIATLGLLFALFIAVMVHQLKVILTIAVPAFMLWAMVVLIARISYTLRHRSEKS